MMNTDGTVPGNFPNVSKTYCACAATQAGGVKTQRTDSIPAAESA
jgi:hypothetical protein